MSDGLWGLIGVIVGTALGFGFTLLSNLQTGKAESKRIKNRVLFFMLEFHRQLSKLALVSAEDGKFLTDYLRERMGDTAAKVLLPKEKEQEYSNAIAHGRFLDAKFAWGRLEAQYPEALEALSRIDPFAAQQLISLGDLLSRMESVFKDDTAMPNNDLPVGPSNKPLDPILQHIQQGLMSNALRTIEQVTLHLAHGPFGGRKRKRLRAIFASNKHAPNEQMQIRVKEMVDKFVWTDAHQEKT